MPVSWIEYKGKRILYADYRNLSKEEMLENIEKQKEIFENEKSLKKIAILCDYRDAFMSEEFMNKSKEYGKKFEDKTEKLAILGIAQGIKKFLLKAYLTFTGQTNVKTFNTEEEAKEFLVSN